MKSEERHELKTNELAQWIADFPEWAKQNLKMITYVSIVLVLVIGSYVYNKYQKNIVQTGQNTQLTQLANVMSQGKAQIVQAQDQGIDISYRLIQTSENLNNLARDIKKGAPAAMALIKSAEASRMELHYRPETISPEEIESKISQAKNDYILAAEKAKDTPAIAAAAIFGTGLCEEELGNFDAAKQIYAQITTDPKFEGTVAIAQAQLRLDTMDEYQQKITFKKTPVTASAPIIQPETKTDTNGLKLPETTE